MRFALIQMYAGYGSTGKNAVRTYNMIREYGHTVKVFYGRKRGKKNYDIERNKDFIFIGNKLIYYVEELIARLLGLSGRMSFLATRKLIKNLNKYKPDVVQLGNIHGNYVNEYKLLNYLKKKNVWVVYVMPDEYAFLGKCCSAYDCEKYRTEKGCHSCEHLREYPRSYIFDNSSIKFKLKKKAYDGFDKVVFRSSQYVVEKARNSYLLKNKEFFVNDSAIDISNVYFPRNTNSIIEKYKFDNSKIHVLLCAPINNPIKGVKYFLNAARILEEKNKNIVFINVSYGGDLSECPTNYVPLPYIDDKNEMAELYSFADAYICTSISDAMPNTCLEALGCGTPIIGFKTSGVPYVADSEHGTFISDISAEALAKEIDLLTKKNEKIIESCHKYAFERYDIIKSNIRLKDFYDNIFDRAKKEMVK